jgi:hypothetical protein
VKRSSHTDAPLAESVRVRVRESQRVCGRCWRISTQSEQVAEAGRPRDLGLRRVCHRQGEGAKSFDSGLWAG